MSFSYANVKSKEIQFGLIIINLKEVIYVANYAMTDFKTGHLVNIITGNPV
jgi:hypothetical protein